MNLTMSISVNEDAQLVVAQSGDRGIVEPVTLSRKQSAELAVRVLFARYAPGQDGALVNVIVRNDGAIVLKPEPSTTMESHGRPSSVP